MSGRRAGMARAAGMVLALLFCTPAPADYQLGLDATDLGDYTTAFAEFARAAAQGDLRAANALGRLYERGDGVERDPQRAAQWYRRAAEAGNREAQYNLAGMYRSGDGVPRDERLSMRWYLSAAAQRLPIAQFFVAKNYEHGQGVSQDLAEAWAWYSLAAEAGDDGAAGNRDRVARYLDDAQRQRAVRLLRDHALELALPPSSLRALGVTAAQGVGAGPGDDEAGRDTVSAIQQTLVELGYEVGAVDGLAGPRTRQALAEFAAAAGMAGDPRIGPGLLEQLRAAVSARRIAASELAMTTAGEQDPASPDTVPVASPGTDAAAPVEQPPALPDAEAAEPVHHQAAAPVEQPPPPADVVPARAASGDEAAPAAAGETPPARPAESLGEALRAFGDVEPAGEQAALAAFARDAGVDMGRPDRERVLLAALHALAPHAVAAPAAGELVRAVQIELTRLGHDPGPVDGLPGARTGAALAEFASAAGYPAAPRLTPVLLARLRATEHSGATPAWARPSVADAATDTAIDLQADAGGASAASPASVTTPPPSGAALVRAAQARLLDLGYEPGPVDGIVGTRTRQAAREFRADRGLAGGTAIDASLLAQLEAVRPLAAPVTSLPEPEPAPAPVADPVREAQRLLAALGFEVGEVDGVVGPRTRAAVRAFELAQGRPESASIDAALVARLREAAGVASSTTAGSAELREAQRQLLARGYRPGNTDGRMDTQTREQLAAFQRDAALPASGELDDTSRLLLRGPPAPLAVSVTLLRAVQAALAERGFDPGPVDGAMGPRTRAAIERFRAAEALPGSGLDGAVVRRLGLGAGG